MDLNQPRFEEKEGKFYLYKADFIPAEQNSGFHPSTSVSGGAPAFYGPFETEEKLQEESMRVFQERAARLS